MKSPFGRGITLLRGLTITMVIHHLLNGMILQVGPCLKHTAKVKNGDTKRERWANIDDEAESLGWQVLSFTGRKNRAICTTFPGTKCLFVFLTKMIFFKYV